MNRKTERLFAGAYYLYISLAFLYVFLLSVKADSSKLDRSLTFALIFLAVLVLLKVALGWKAWNGPAAAAAAVCLLVLPGALRFERYHILLYFVAVLGAYGMDMKKVFRLLLAEVSVLTAGVVILCLAGVLPNTVTYRNTGAQARYSMGFVYTTYFSSYLMVTVALWAYLRKEQARWFELVGMGVLGILCQAVSNARIDCLTVMLILAALLTGKLLERKPRWRERMMCRPVQLVCINMANLLAAAALLMAVLYRFDSSFWQKVSSLLSRRPYSNAVTLQRYLITLWGQCVINHDSISQGMEGVGSSYYIINCSYMEVFALLGAAGLFAVLFMWTLLSYREARKKEVARLLILVAYSLLFFLEQRLADISINPFFLLLFGGQEVSAFALPELWPEKKRKESARMRKALEGKGKLAVTALMVAVLLEVCVFNYGAMMSAANSGLTMSDLSLASVDFVKQEETDTYVFETDAPSLEVGNVFNITGIDSVNIWMNLYTLGSNEEYRVLDDVSYDVDIYLYNDVDATFDYLKTYTVSTSDISSGYVPLNLDYTKQYYKFTFHFPEKCQVDICKIEFNGPRPFQISFLRLGIAWAACFLLRLLLERTGMMEKLTADMKGKKGGAGKTPAGAKSNGKAAGAGMQVESREALADGQETGNVPQNNQ